MGFVLAAFFKSQPKELTCDLFNEYVEKVYTNVDPQNRANRKNLNDKMKLGCEVDNNKVYFTAQYSLEIDSKTSEINRLQTIIPKYRYELVDYSNETIDYQFSLALADYTKKYVVVK
jgi:hypothetical protein